MVDAQSILMKKGYIYKGRHEGWYSVSDEAFYSSTQVSDQTDPSTGESYKVSLSCAKGSIQHRELGSMCW